MKNSGSEQNKIKAQYGYSTKTSISSNSSPSIQRGGTKNGNVGNGETGASHNNNIYNAKPKYTSWHKIRKTVDIMQQTQTIQQYGGARLEPHRVEKSTSSRIYISIVFCSVLCCCIPWVSSLEHMLCECVSVYSNANVYIFASIYI